MKNESDPLTRNHEGTIVGAMRKIFSTIPSILVLCLAFVLLTGLQGCSQNGETKASDETEVSKDDDYPLDNCVVSGKKLGEMGEPHVHDHNGTTVKFCCEPCLDDFNEDPYKYLAKLRK